MENALQQQDQDTGGGIHWLHCDLNSAPFGEVTNPVINSMPMPKTRLVTAIP